MQPNNYAPHILEVMYYNCNVKELENIQKNSVNLDFFLHLEIKTRLLYLHFFYYVTSFKLGLTLLTYYY